MACGRCRGGQPCRKAYAGHRLARRMMQAGFQHRAASPTAHDCRRERIDSVSAEARLQNVRLQPCNALQSQNVETPFWPSLVITKASQACVRTRWPLCHTAMAYERI